MFPLVCGYGVLVYSTVCLPTPVIVAVMFLSSILLVFYGTLNTRVGWCDVRCIGVVAPEQGIAAAVDSLVGGLFEPYLILLAAISCVRLLCLSRRAVISSPALVDREVVPIEHNKLLTFV